MMASNDDEDDFLNGLSDFESRQPGGGGSIDMKDEVCVKEEVKEESPYGGDDDEADEAVEEIAMARGDMDDASGSGTLHESGQELATTAWDLLVWI